MSESAKLKLLLTMIVVTLAAVFFVDPVAQDVRYHQFADEVEVAGIPNVWNVLSNVPFIVIGILGFLKIREYFQGRPHETYYITCQVFFIGLILTGFGSGYYHLSPTNETLVWDRLPMTISFMAFFSFVISLHIHQKLGAQALWPLLAIGVASVLYWSYTEGLGAGDLRFYAVVQFLPMLLIPTILLMFPVSDYPKNYVWLLIALYVVAKLVEYYDVGIYQLLGVSGHTIKHIVASLTGLAFMWAVTSIKRRG